MEPFIARTTAGKRRRAASSSVFSDSPLTFLDAADSARTIETVRNGLPAPTVDYVASLLSISRAALLGALHIPASTIERRIRTQAKLSAEESDRITRVAKVLRRAVAVFGDAAQAKAWMTDKVSALGGVSPLSLLDTSEGAELVFACLGRIEYGVYA